MQPVEGGVRVKVWGWTAGSDGCAAYRVRWPFDALAANTGLEVAHGTRITPQWREAADVVVGQRLCRGGPTKQWQRWAADGSKRLVFEVDDDLWHVDRENQRAYYLFGRDDVRANLEANIRAAHTVTVSTEPLAEVVRAETGHTDVRVIPNAVPPWLLDHQAPRTHLLGWGGSPTHHRDFAELRRPLAKFLESHPEATLHTLGMDYAAWMRLPKEQCHHTPWTAAPEDFLRAIDYEIGIIPLAPSVFARSKSDCKLVELAALGIPAVASAVGPYTPSIRHGHTGLLVKYDHEWGRHLRALANDPAMRAELGAAAKEWARGRTTDSTWPLWLEAITGNQPRERGRPEPQLQATSQPPT